MTRAATNFSSKLVGSRSDVILECLNIRITGGGASESSGAGESIIFLYLPFILFRLFGCMMMFVTRRVSV